MEYFDIAETSLYPGRLPSRCCGIHQTTRSSLIIVADLTQHPACAHLPGPKFSQFRAVLEILAKLYFGVPRRRVPLLRRILDPSLSYINLTLRRQKRINVNSRRAALMQRDISMKTTAFSAAVTLMSNVENKLLKIPCQFVLPE